MIHVEQRCGDMAKPAGHGEHSDALVAPPFNLPAGHATHLTFFVSVSGERRRLEAERFAGAGVVDTKLVVKAEVIGGVDDEGEV